MYVLDGNLGFDFGAMITAATPLVETGVKTYGQIQTIRNQPSQVTTLIPQQQQPQVVYTQAPAQAAPAAPKKSKVGQYLTIGVLIAVGLGGGLMLARRRSRR